MPPETFEAYRDHGDPKVRIHDDLDAAHAAFRGARRGSASISTTVSRELEDEGVKKFSDSFDSLLQAIAAKGEGDEGRLSESGSTDSVLVTVPGGRKKRSVRPARSSSSAPRET